MSAPRTEAEKFTATGAGAEIAGVVSLTGGAGAGGVGAVVEVDGKMASGKLVEGAFVAAMLLSRLIWPGGGISEFVSG